MVLVYISGVLRALRIGRCFYEVLDLSLELGKYIQHFINKAMAHDVEIVVAKPVDGDDDRAASDGVDDWPGEWL